MNPFYKFDTPITSKQFDARVKAAARRYLSWCSNGRIRLRPSFVQEDYIYNKINSRRNKLFDLGVDWCNKIGQFIGIAATTQFFTTPSMNFVLFRNDIFNVQKVKLTWWQSLHGIVLVHEKVLFLELIRYSKDFFSKLLSTLVKYMVLHDKTPTKNIRRQKNWTVLTSPVYLMSFFGSKVGVYRKDSMLFVMVWDRFGALLGRSWYFPERIATFLTGTALDA